MSTDPVCHNWISMRAARCSASPKIWVTFFFIFALLVHFSMSQPIFQLFQSIWRIMHEAERKRETCEEGREMPLLSGQALLLGVWPWKCTPFSKTSNGSHIGYHYYAVICMHPFVSFPFNHARGFPAQFLKLVIKNNADLNWRLTFHLQALMVWWMEQLQSQSKITPPQAGLRPWIPRPMSTQTGDNDLWLPRRPQPSPSQSPRLTDRDFLLRWEPSRHSPAIKGLPSVTEADLQQELIHTVSHVCSPTLPPSYTYI